MFQKELARRIAAPPGSRDYGRVSVLAQYAARLRTVARVNRDQFIPAPSVDSEVIELDFSAPPEFPARSESVFFDVVKAAFGKRRKMLKNSLAASELGLDARQVDAALDRAGIAPTRRAETLSLAEFAALSDAVMDEAKSDVI